MGKPLIDMQLDAAQIVKDAFAEGQNAVKSTETDLKVATLTLKAIADALGIGSHLTPKMNSIDQSYLVSQVKQRVANSKSSADLAKTFKAVAKELGVYVTDAMDAADQSHLIEAAKWAMKDISHYQKSGEAYRDVLRLIRNEVAPNVGYLTEDGRKKILDAVKALKTGDGETLKAIAAEVGLNPSFYDFGNEYDRQALMNQVKKMAFAKARYQDERNKAERALSWVGAAIGSSGIAYDAAGQETIVTDATNLAKTKKELATRDSQRMQLLTQIRDALGLSATSVNVYDSDFASKIVAKANKEHADAKIARFYGYASR